FTRIVHIAYLRHTKRVERCISTNILSLTGHPGFGKISENLTALPAERDLGRGRKDSGSGELFRPLR
ncbi:MAG: hypothetical protein LBE91_13500, partial [Tannerella sp.]|nr:hypothetical protein [Tannerella sp.]